MNWATIRSIRVNPIGLEVCMKVSFWRSDQNWLRSGRSNKRGWTFYDRKNALSGQSSTKMARFQQYWKKWKLSNFEINKKTHLTSFHIKFYDSTLILSHLWPTSVELCYVEKNPFWQNLPTWSIFSIVKSPTSFVWTPTAQPILVGSSKTYLHAHLQTYRVHTNTSDGCSVHPSWRSCAFKIGGTFFLGRRK